MRNTLKYKDYYGSVGYSSEDDCFIGKIIGVNDIVTFKGNSTEELKHAFQDAVDGYLDMCSRTGKSPEKTYKGTFNVRIDPTLHKSAAIFANMHNKTLNAVVEEAIQRMVRGQ